MAHKIYTASEFPLLRVCHSEKKIDKREVNFFHFT